MDNIEVVDYQPAWRDAFLAIAADLRHAIGETALRIDHVGSTSIIGLAAKPIIDIQISVQPLQRMEDYQPALERVGYRYRADNEDLTKRYFREMPGFPRTHIHVREAGSWSEQLNLLFRDYLREHPADCARYAEIKYDLAARYRDQRDAYVIGKEEIVWSILRQAHAWSMQVGWKPSASDA